MEEKINLQYFLVTRYEIFRTAILDRRQFADILSELIKTRELFYNKNQLPEEGVSVYFLDKPIKEGDFYFYKSLEERRLFIQEHAIFYCWYLTETEYPSKILDGG